MSAVLDQALDLPEDRQTAYIDEACTGDPELRTEVERLLRAYRASGPFLSAPAVELAAPLIFTLPPLEAGRRLGPWRILREIGRGGMARVYEGERADGQFEQRVAIKLLRPGLDSDLDLGRFRLERQVLASLSHPNIARMLDGGLSDDGLPYLVMERVDGRPIDAYCQEQGLPVRQRLALFLTVSDATQSAHQSLVVHRDLKPGNILVSREGVVKLVDFGLAKLLEPDRSGSSPATRTAQRWMTPEFAAPEQIRGEPPTTLTDVYQLGVVLYQLLCGRLPFRAQGGARALEDAILAEEPAAPSSVAGDATRSRQLQGDLDAIVLKALRKEPGLRYASVQEFSDDVRRYLAGLPVRARRQTTAYRWGRFARRHRLGLAAAALVVLLLGSWVGTIIVQGARIQAALAEANEAVRRAEQTTDFMMGLFQAAEGGRALTDSVTARELLSRGVTQARLLSGQPALQAQILDVTGRLYTQLGEYARARPLLEEALARRRSLHGDAHPDVATSLESLAAVADLEQRLDEAVALRRQALELRRRVEGTWSTKSTDGIHALALSLHRAGHDSLAWPLFDEWSAAIAEQPPSPTGPRADQLGAAAALAQWRGEHERAEAMIRDALEIRRSVYGARHPLVASTLSELGAMLDGAGRQSEAEPLLREAVEVLRAAYPEGHPSQWSALRNWAFVLQRLGRFQESVAPLREALAVQRRFVGDSSLDAAIAKLDLANALSSGGEYLEAEALARDGARTLEAQLGAENAMVALARLHVGDALRGQGRVAEAEPILLAGYERFREPSPITRNWRGLALSALARLREAQGRPEEARRYREMIEAPAEDEPPG